MNRFEQVAYAAAIECGQLGEDWRASAALVCIPPPPTSSAARETSAECRVDFDESGLPAATRRLLPMLRTLPQDAAIPHARVGLVERAGEWALVRWADGAALTTLAGEAVLRAAPALRGKARTRAGELLNLIYDTSVVALPMMVLVNILVGAIVAFVGGIQLAPARCRHICEQSDRGHRGS